MKVAVSSGRFRTFSVGSTSFAKPDQSKLPVPVRKIDKVGGFGFRKERA